MISREDPGMSDVSAASDIGQWSAAEGTVARSWYRSRSTAQHVAIAAQLATLLGLLYVLEIEPGAGLTRILPLVFVGRIRVSPAPGSISRT